MISVTQKSIELLNANSRTFRMKLVNGSEEYTNILSLKWSAALPSYLSIGNAICTCVECSAIGIPISIKGTNLKVYITVLGSDDWVQIGTFKAEKPTLQNGVVSFSAYDIMNECSKAIFTHKLGTVTIGECYEAVITDIESEIGTVSYVSLPSSVAYLKINADLLIGYDCRNVLAYIAGYLGCNCVVNNMGAIEMRSFTVCDYTLNDNRIAEPELDDGISDLEFLACSVNSDTKLLYGNNGEGFEFICPIMTQERLDEIGATLCASAVNVYRSGKIKHILGDFRFQIGDIVSLEYGGETHIIPISSIIFEFDGGLSADIESLPFAEASALSLSDTLDFISKQNANKRITGITNYYLATSEPEGVTKDRSDWTDTIQNVTADKKYLWNYEVVTLADGTSYETEPCIIGNFAENGQNGRGIKSITEYYLTTQTEAKPSKTSFKPNVQTPTETLPFLWNYEKIEYTDDSEPYESEVRIIGVYGTKGENGETLYTWIKYADDANGTNISDSPAGKKYIGIATNKTTETESNVPSDYKWSLIQGTDGRGVSKVETEYYLSISDQYLSGDSWSANAPTWVDGRYLWTRFATTYTDGAVEYSDPVVDSSWKKTTAVEAASKELNETLANALGLHVTETTVSGSKIRYYHTNPVLSASKSGDTILVLNANGFGVCKSGWNGGNPQFTYGTTFDGKAVWDILVANKINADLIEAGTISSVDGAKVKTTLNLGTGEMIFESSNAILGITGGNDNETVEKEVPSAGIAFENKSTGDIITHTLDGIQFFTAEFLSECVKWLNGEAIPAILNGREIDYSSEPNFHYSRVQLDKIQTKKIYCEDIFIFNDEKGNESFNLIKNIGEQIVGPLDSLGEAVSILQEKFVKLEEALGQQHEHTPLSPIQENVINPTCTTSGSYDSVIKCATCGEEISRTQITTPATGHSDSNGDGYCDVCGAKVGTFYTITVQSNDTSMGTASGSGSYVSGKSITITATPKAGYKFVRWNDGNTNASRTVAVSANKTYTAYFELIPIVEQKTLITEVYPAGSGTITPGGTYEQGTALSVSVTPVGNYIHSGWRVTNSETGEVEEYDAPINPLGINLNANLTVTAIFTQKPSGEPTITAGETKTVDIGAGETVYLKFIPTASGTYEFASLGTSNDDVVGYLFDSNKSEIANNDDGAGNRQFLLTQYLTAGTTYYWGVKYFNSAKTGSVSVKLTQQASSGGGSGYAEDTFVGNTLYIADGTIEIPQQAYDSNDNINILHIANTVQTIGAVAFANCPNIRTVYIPNSVSLIGSGAFVGCFSIEDVYYSGTVSQWNAITIADRNTYLTDATIHYNS